ncbi:uncharacterized protein [Watersipora subatra]|uniref:uncharacterized protein n=1 Tax=Watersipora subatra TaxID=2589382 RepID=UPI00355BE88E
MSIIIKTLQAEVLSFLYCSSWSLTLHEKFKMNKFAVLLLLVICAAWTADAQRRGNRRNSGGGRMRVIEEVESISETNRGGKRRMQQSVNLQEIVENAEISNPLGRRRNARFEEQVFFPTTGLPPVGLQRRGNEFLGAQRAFERKNRRGAGRGAAAGSSLKAGERHLDAIQALLQKKQARQERIDAKAEKKARRKDAARAAAGDKLKEQNAFEYDTFEKADQYNDLTAQANIDLQNEFGMQIGSSDRHKENAALAENSGNSFDAGTKLQVHEAFDTANYVQDEVFFEDELVDNELLNAEGALADALNAKDSSKIENEATVDAQNFAQIGSRFEKSDGAFGKFGSNSPFDDVFGKK